MKRDRIVMVYTSVLFALTMLAGVLLLILRA